MSSGPTDDPTPTRSERAPEQPTIMGLLAERVRMTEGQLYTVVIALVVALLLTVTGLPTAHTRSDDDFSGSGVPALTPTSTTAPASSTTAQEAP